MAAVAASTLPLGVATALGAFEGTNADAQDPYSAGHGPHEEGYNTNRAEVARGHSPLGAWRMYTSSGPEGDCVEVELPDRNPPGGGRAFYSDCSDSADAPVNPSTIADEHGALIYGLVPPETASVEVRRTAAADLAARVWGSRHASGPRSFLVATPDPSVDGTIRALAADGQSVAAEPVP